jgi:hypothetical protein
METASPSPAFGVKTSPTGPVTLGDRLIAELGRRQAMGFSLRYKDYQRLHAVDSLDELRQFLDALGCVGARADLPLEELAQALLEQPTRRRLASPWRSLRMVLVSPGIWLSMMYVLRWGGNRKSPLVVALMFAPLCELPGLLIGWHFNAPISGFLIGRYWLVALAGIARIRMRRAHAA